MNLDTIRNFDWYNEPEFSFSSGALIIKPQAETDFWQDKRNNIKKDNGHFFFSRSSGNFELIVKWKRPKKTEEICQFGLMGRVDDQNWCKISVIKIQKEMFLFLSVTCLGISDSVIIPIVSDFNIVNYRLYYSKGVFSLSYSLDEQEFMAVRHFQMHKDFDYIDIGAYICNPNQIVPHPDINNDMKTKVTIGGSAFFECELLDIDINYF